MQAHNFFFIALWLGFGYLGCWMAASRGRSPVLGFFGGMFFTGFAIIYYLIAGDTMELRIMKEASVKKKLGIEK